MATFIADQRTGFGVPHAVACRALNVSESWFYKWLGRPPTVRQRRRAELAEQIKALFSASGGTYGSPRIHQDLLDAGWRVSVNTVAALMAELDLVGRTGPRRRGLTRPGTRPVAPDLVRRVFDAVAPDVLWCGDLAEIVTVEGKVFCASVIDLFSRRVLGFAFGEHHDAALVTAALQMAVATRGGEVGGMIFHSDRGSEHTSALFGGACWRSGVVQSMAGPARRWTTRWTSRSTACSKVLFVHRHAFTTRAEARLRIATWISDFYNTRRRHSKAGNLPPVEFERVIRETRKAHQVRYGHQEAALDA